MSVKKVTGLRFTVYGLRSQVQSLRPYTLHRIPHSLAPRFAISLLTLIVLLSAPHALAQYSSTNYQSNEVFFGTGGDLDASSPNYKAQSSVGGLGVGNVSSANYQAYSGFLTPNEPFLEFNMNTSTVNLGVLDSSSTRTGTATFYVRAYLDSGYTVQTMSQPPTVTGTTAVLNPMTTLGASNVGTEQFGINLRANTSPATFGADPVPQPDSTFANGQAATGYNTVNQYKYSVGDVIAQTSSTGWGMTVYTLSYIANASELTEAGDYRMIHDLVVVATY